MANEHTTSWGQRGKKTSVVALGLVAILAGVAVAYFLTSQRFGGNSAIGGSLTVNASLPLDYTDEPLYPTNEDGTGDAVVDKDFTVENLNSVKVSYEIFATCEECIPNPADTPDDAAARQKKIDQFNQLYVDIQTSPAPTCGDTDKLSNNYPDGEVEGTNTDPLDINKHCGAPIYHGRLADLNGDNKKSLGQIAAGADKTYTVKLWLKNDPNKAQPQEVLNTWEFVINAKTPVS